MADYKNKDAQWEKQIQDDMQLAGSVDVRGTPTFYLNGRKTNARDLNSFKAQIDPILAGQR
jgi:protein-disulfide isomerase